MRKNNRKISFYYFPLELPPFAINNNSCLRLFICLLCYNRNDNGDDDENGNNRKNFNVVSSSLSTFSVSYYYYYQIIYKVINTKKGIW